ncbi:MAG: lactate utilization protein C [Betaproteobacteria bacterium]|nr:lactate utilization protein C [Betaproteobacteria bacterium]
MSARERILSRIRQAQGRGREGGPSQAEQESVETYIRAHPRAPLPPVEGDLVERFIARALAMQSTCERVGGDSDVPAAVARYLQVHKLPVAGCVWPALVNLDWRGAGLDLAARGANGDDLVGVTGVFAAVAETGTLMVCSGPDTPSTVSLLPETHIAIVPSPVIVAHMEDAWDRARAVYGQLPRAVNFISGPSRTGDIEQRMVMGAHGPYRVHIIVVGL